MCVIAFTRAASECSDLGVNSGWCCVATEIKLELTNLIQRELTLEDAKVALKDPELSEVTDENLTGWVDGTLRKDEVLLRLHQFMPEFMNKHVMSLFHGLLDPSQTGADLAYKGAMS